jgi:hypothetical protein
MHRLVKLPSSFKNQSSLSGRAGGWIRNLVLIGLVNLAISPGVWAAKTCSYTISPTSASVAASGGSGTVSVSTASGCTWTAASNAGWITITSGGSGRGNASVGYSVAANTGSARTGTLTVAGKSFTIAQAGTCSYAISPTSASVAAAGGTGSVTVTAGTGCSWTAASNASWITITAGTSGTGNGTVSYSVAGNTSTSSRTGTLTVAGNTFTVTQAGASTVSADVQLSNGAPYNDSLTASTRQAEWKYYYIDVPSGATELVVDVYNMSADVDLYVKYNAKPTLTVYDCRPYIGGTAEQCRFTNPSAGRWWIGVNNYATGTITFTVKATYASCSVTISPTSASFTASGGTGSVSVTASTGCSWTATSNASWITITAGSSGTGNGTVSYSVAGNTGTTSRSGTLTIDGQTFTVTQAGASTSTDVQLSNGVPYNDSLTATTKQSGWKYYFIDVPSGTSSLVIDVYNMSADVDLYVKYNEKPTLTIWSCRPYIGGTSEQCSFSAPAAGRWWIGVNNYATGTITYTVKATYSTCSTTISPTSASFTGSGGTGSVTVTAGTGCSWTATSNAGWITVTGGSSGTGNGTVSYSVAVNSLSSSRSGTMTIAGQTFTVTQAGTPCSVTISPTSASFAATGGTGSISVSAGSSCSWTASSAASWITITAGSSGTGNGTVSYSVAANLSTSSRTGTIGIDGQTFTVSQAGATSTGSGTFQWSWVFGGPYQDFGNGVAVDKRDGSVYLTASFSDPVDFGGGLIIGTSGSNILLAKYAADGSYLWAKAFPGTGSGAAMAAAVDANGNVIITGYFTSSFNFGGGSLVSAGGSDIFVVKLTAAGEHVWSKRFGSDYSGGWPGDEGGCAIAVDSSGNVLVGGQFNGTVNFGGATFSSGGTAGNKDGFVLKLSGLNGSHLWSKQIGDINSGDTVKGVATDSTGNVVVTGMYQGTQDFGGGPLASSGNDIFVAKYTGAGAYMWAKRFGGMLGDSGNAVAVDGSGNVVVTGYFAGTVDFGGGSLTAAGNNDIFLLKLSSAGAYVWAKKFGGGVDIVNGTVLDSGNGVAVDSNGNVLMSGYFLGTADFGGGSVLSTGSTDIFLAKYSSTGSFTWAKSFGATNIDEGKAVAVDDNGNSLITGRFSVSIDFGGGLHLSAGQGDIYLAKFGP